MRSTDPSEHEMTVRVVGKLLLGQLQLGRLPHCQVRGQEAQELTGSWGSRAGGGNEAIGYLKMTKSVASAHYLPHLHKHSLHHSSRQPSPF